MILLALRETPETRGDQWPCKAFRWVLEASGSVKGRNFSIGLVHQHQSRETGTWRSSHTTVYEASVTRTFRFGFEHFYYDGPHCSFSLGPLHLQWYPRGGHCSKCMDA